MQAEYRQCKSPTELFSWLQQIASDTPALAFSCAGLLETDAQRDRIRRDAFMAALSNQPEVARQYLSAVIDRPWITDAGFFPLASLALSISRDDPGNARKLLLKAAQRYPGLALRDSETYSREVFEEAARAAPDEAVGLACGTSAAAHKLLERLEQSPSPEIQLLARLATSASLSLQVKSRAAVFYRQVAAGTLTFAQAVESSSGSRYFSALADLRISTSGPEAALYDRVLENYAEVLFRFDGFSPELKQLSARDLYLLLTYGRTEEDDKLFTTIFDRLLLPKLKSTPPTKLLDEVHNLNLRRFLVSAIAHHRLEPLSELLPRAMRGIERADRPLEETVAAAEIVNAVQNPVRLRQLRDVVNSEYNSARISRPLYGLLAAAIARKLAPDELASEYLRYFKDDGVLDAAALFTSAATCIQQHFFYDDVDAAESFESFKQTYARDPAWQWQDQGWYIHVTGTGPTARRIEIYANVPHSTNSKDTDDRRHAMAKMMASQGLLPTVVVHRGHTWYVEQTLQYLQPGARLVYLGSCRGIESTYSVISLAKRAQIIASTGIGTLWVNDPLLKAINDELLQGAPTLDWNRFWLKQDALLKHNPAFRDYLPPPRNASAIMLAAYFAAGQ